MKETIYTIPLNDAFDANDECPFCFIERKLEQEAIAFILGPAYMEDDIRAETDILGFCRHHHKMMHDYGNQLGVALMLHTYYQKMNKELSQEISGFSVGKKSFKSPFSKPKAAGSTPSTSLARWVKKKDETCYVCNHFQEKYPRYLNTFFHLYQNDPQFKEKFKNSKGFCLNHFADLTETAQTDLNPRQQEEFFPLLFEIMKENMKRLEEDISWFVDKYDYRNKDASWKNSKDAIPRCIQKLSGSYPADPVFKSK